MKGVAYLISFCGCIIFFAGAFGKEEGTLYAFIFGWVLLLSAALLYAVSK